MMVYVFNCSEQMDYKSCGQIYKGLSASGAFGIFDGTNFERYIHFNSYSAYVQFNEHGIV